MANHIKYNVHVYVLSDINREVDTKVKKLLEKTEKSGQLSPEVRKCIQSASTLDDIETLAAQFKTSSQQSLASRARAIPNLEATAHMYLQSGPSSLLQKASGMYLLEFLKNDITVPASKMAADTSRK